MSNRVIFPFVGLITMASLATAQSKPQSLVRDTSFVVNAGAKLNDVIPAKHLYHYPGFLTSTVLFRDGKVSEAKMNYNRLMDEMLFISQNGDTLAIADEPTVKLIFIGKDTFYFDRGYVRLLKDGGTVKLGVKQGFKRGDRRKHTGYGMMSSTSSVSSLSSLYDDRRIYQLEVKEQALISTATQYYLGDQYSRFVLATEKNLLQLFPKCTGPIKNFCKKSNINFNLRADLEKLVSFVEGNCF